MARKTAKVEEFTSLYFDVKGSNKMERLQKFYDRWAGCTRCPLSEFRETDDIVFAEGNPDADCMIIGEAPGEHEEQTGVPFVGPSGQLLNQLLAQSSYDPEMNDLAIWYSKVPHTKENTTTFHDAIFEWRKKNFFITNVVGCRPPENRTPTDTEVKGCWERLYNLIYTVDPLLIITAGKTPIEALLKKKVEITRQRGELFDCTYKGRLGTVMFPVIATLHPSFLLRKADWKDETGSYASTLKDFRLAMGLLRELRIKTGRVR